MRRRLPDDARLHPVAAWRAIRRLVRDPEDTKQAFLLIEALRGRSTRRLLARLRRSPGGGLLLASRPSLLAHLGDRAALAALPAGSLGRAYLAFIGVESLSAEGLAEVSRVTRPSASDDIAWLRERNREMHDLIHVVVGYGRDPLGEVCVAAVSYAQTGLKGFAVIAAVGALRIARRLRGQPVRGAVWEAYRQGRRARWLIDADWETLLAEPLDAVRAQYRVAPPAIYPQVLPHLQQALAEAAARRRLQAIPA